MLAGELIRTGLGISANSSKLRNDDFWVLDDINFKLFRGETIALLGMNGAGKSTLLRILSNLIVPDRGSVELYGEVGSLIDLNAGMKFDLSGRENIYIKGALMGKTRKQMDELYEEIFEFSELGEFIHAPMKSYSSGMRLRLGFSISACVKPDILLLDEVLAVGDHAFRKKCELKLAELREGAGVVFASHSLGMVRKICQSAIVLDKGKLIFWGSVDDAIDHHMRIGNDQNAIAQTAEEKNENAFWGKPFFKRQRIAEAQHGWCNEDGSPETVFYTNEPAYFDIQFTLNDDFSEIIAGLSIWTEQGERVTSISSDMSKVEVFSSGERKHAARISMPSISLNPGNYVTTFAVMVDGNLAYKQLNENISVTSKYLHAGTVTPTHNWVKM
ncbi:ABC transporter ATP-binding protein [Hirschia litorea]|uniref:ABC transporter ATP-binding protein n=1 Tax=Hirschia litorea TaxID=1199156 RepID=A0ABW2IQ20_9PROT